MGPGERRPINAWRSRADFKGRLAAIAAGQGAGQALAEAVKRYEALGRHARPADLLCLAASMPATPPIRCSAKFYGDVQERITAASLHLLFFTLELNRIDDAVLEAAMADPALGHYRPWIEDVRKEKPYQLEDRVEELFHEKSVTGYSAWNRQYRRDHRRAALQDRRQVADASSRRSICCRTPTARSARRRRRRWPRPSRKTCGRSR